MANNQLFQFKDIKNKPHRSAFDLSKRLLYTSKVGEILPVYCKPTMPGDKWHINLQSFTRTQTVQSSAFTRIKEHIDFFFVPYHILWRNFQNSFTQISNSSNFAASPTVSVPIKDKIPYINQRTLFIYAIKSYGAQMQKTDIVGADTLQQVLKLLSYLGYSDLTRFTSDELRSNFDTLVGNNVPDVNVSIMPLLAYQKIYYDFFRNDQWENNKPTAFNVDYMVDSTNLADFVTNENQLFQSGMITMQYCNFAKDMFLGLLPSAQFGDSSVVSSSVVGTAYLPKDSNLGISTVFESRSGSHITSKPTNPDITTKTGENLFVYGSPQDGSYLTVSPKVNQDLPIELSSLSTQFDILKLRQTQALQKWKEITQCGDFNYRSQVEKHFGVKLPELMAHRCTYIGGSQGVVSINEVVNQNLIDGNEAEIKGKGTGSLNDGDFRYECKEHGLIIGVYYAIPYVDYKISGTSRDLTTINIADMPIPEFDRLGFEPFSIGEMFYKFNAPSGWKDFIGYAPRYYNYKTDVDEVKGAFSVSLPNWVAQYDADYIPLSNSFNLLPALKVRASILDDIFGVNAFTDGTQVQINTDQLLNCVNFEVHTVRNLDYNGVPY